MERDLHLNLKGVKLTPRWIATGEPVKYGQASADDPTTTIIGTRKTEAGNPVLLVTTPSGARYGTAMRERVMFCKPGEGPVPADMAVVPLGEDVVPLMTRQAESILRHVFPAADIQIRKWNAEREQTSSPAPECIELVVSGNHENGSVLIERRAEWVYTLGKLATVTGRDGDRYIRTRDVYTLSETVTQYDSHTGLTDVDEREIGRDYTPWAAVESACSILIERLLIEPWTHVVWRDYFAAEERDMAEAAEKFWDEEAKLAEQNRLARY